MDTAIPEPGPAPAPLPKPPVAAQPRGQVAMFLVLQRNPLELWGEGAYSHVGIIPGRFMGRQQLLLTDPAAIRHVLVDNPDAYGRNLATRRVLAPVLGNGLFLAEGKTWRHQRRTIAPAFVPRTMGVLARHVVAASEPVEEQLGRSAGRPVELLPVLQRLALDIAGQSMFSLEMGAFGADLRALLAVYAARHARPGFLDLTLPAHIPSPADRARARFRRAWMRLIDTMIASRREAPPDEGTPRDLFDILAAATDPETGEGLPPEQLRDEVATLILAGHETTGVTLFWACYLAARLPEQAERVAQEAWGMDLSGMKAAAAIKNLPVTRAFVDEALRLYPPAFLILRQAREADRIGDQPIAPGTVVSIPPWVLHRHRQFWDDPDGFRLDRFLPGQAAPERFTYLPFGAGPRICVGAQFALTEAVLVLARLLRRFRVRLSGTGTVVPRGVVTTQPDRPVRFILSPRQGLA